MIERDEITRNVVIGRVQPRTGPPVLRQELSVLKIKITLALHTFFPY